MSDNNKEIQEKEVQYILNENKELVEISKDLCKPVEFPISYRLSSAFEVFVGLKAQKIIGFPTMVDA